MIDFLSLIPQTAPYMVFGYVWQRWPRQHITSTFVTVSPLCGHLIDTPYVNIEREFFLPRVSPPEVYDTLVQVSCYKLLVTGYLNGSLGPNPNLQHDFPHPLKRRNSCSVHQEMEALRLSSTASVVSPFCYYPVSLGCEYSSACGC